MFFTKLGRVIATLAVVVGLLQLVMGIILAAQDPEAGKLASMRYTEVKSAGLLIDQSLYICVFAVVLGTLVEISVSLRRLTSNITSHSDSSRSDEDRGV